MMTIMNTDKKGHTISIMLNDPKDRIKAVNHILKVRKCEQKDLDNPIIHIYG